MSDDPLAGLRAYIQETETRLNDLEIASRNHYAVVAAPHVDQFSPVDETLLLAQIQRMGQTIATMQEQLVKVAIERDDWKRQYEISAHLVSGPQI